MEKVSCPVCKCKRVIKKEKCGEYNWFFCSNCEVVFAWPLVPKRELYETWYKNETMYGYHSSLKRAKIIEFFQDFFTLNKCYSHAISSIKKEFKNSLHKPVVFDIGCGTGKFLKQCQRNGFICIGCDISNSLIIFLKKQNLMCFYGTFEKYPENFPKPDIITAFEVLEHLSDPLSFLKGIKRKFPDVKKIFMSVPNPKRFTLYISKDHEIIDTPPHHFTKWNKKSLYFLFKMAGYKNVSVISFSPNILSFLWMFSDYFHTGITKIFKKEKENFKNIIYGKKKSFKGICYFQIFSIFKFLVLLPYAFLKYIMIFDTYRDSSYFISANP